MDKRIFGPPGTATEPEDPLEGSAAFLRVYKMCCSDGLRLVGGEKEGEAGLDDEVL